MAMNGTCNAGVYHEKQVKELCALHALNNLFQSRDAFSKSELDEICQTLSPHVWINPHKSLIGLGNYDVNVIMAALHRKGCEAIWFDKRKPPECLQLNHILGFILNVPSDYRFGFVLLPLKKRHWIAIRQIGDIYFNLDSKLDVPQVIGQENDLICYLKEQLDSRDKELFIVVSKEIEETHLWEKEDYDLQAVSRRLASSPHTTENTPRASLFFYYFIAVLILSISAIFIYVIKT